MDNQILNKKLPHSIEAEKSVLGSMIIDEDAIIVAAEILSKEDFYKKDYGIIFETIVDLQRQGKSIEPLTIQEALKGKDIPEVYTDSGDTLRSILEVVPTSSHIKDYVGIVSEKAFLRRLIKASEDISVSCYKDGAEVDEIAAETEKRIFSILQRSGDTDDTSIKDVALEVLNKIQLASKTQGNITGAPTGFIDLDYKTSGMHGSDLVLIAARPSMGKTAFVLNIAQHMACRKGIPVALFSLEMSKSQLVTRLLAMESHVDAQVLRTGNLSEEDWVKVAEGLDTISSSQIFIDDTPGISIPQLRSKCRKWKLEHDIGVIIIDYLQLMSSGRKSESRQQEISEISRALKGIARELNVPVLALSQLSRGVETRTDRRPMLSDLRESGAIEQDADVVMFIYRDDYYNPNTEKKGIAEIIIAKQRNGPIGTIELVWLPKYTQFVNMQK